MFSGIVEATTQIIRLQAQDQSYSLVVKRPANFSDIKIGDSIATNGVCLTVEEFSQDFIRFTLGPETLQVIQFQESHFLKHSLNLERSLQWGARLHGHMVTGHVEGLARISRADQQGDSLLLAVDLAKSFQKYIIPKGSLCLNGVSLTINAIESHADFLRLHFCLIPETLEKTNLKEYAVGETLNFETDAMVKSLETLVENLLEEKLKARLSSQEVNSPLGKGDSCV